MFKYIIDIITSIIQGTSIPEPQSEEDCLMFLFSELYSAIFIDTDKTNFRFKSIQSKIFIRKFNN